MHLRSYLRVLRERWKLIVGVVVVAVVVAVAVTVLTPKSYSASAQVFVAASAKADPSVQAQANSYVQTQVTSYAKVIDSPAVVGYVQNTLKPSLTDQQIRNELTASAETGESIVDIHVSDGSASRAADLANSAARGFVRAIETYSPYTRLFVTGPATTPSSPTSPQPALNIALGVILGLLVGAALARVRDVLDNRVREPDDVAAAAAAPLMGVIVDDARTAKYPVAARDTSRSIRGENYRQLRTNVQFSDIDGGSRVIAITSPLAGEGKTMVAVNLASSLAEAGFTVCLVDADLRRPSVATVLGLLPDVGLTNVLVRRLAVRDVLQAAGDRLHVLTSGPTPPNPSEIIASGAMRALIRSLLEFADYVVLDTAPLLPVADAAEAAALADTTLLVARYGVTTDRNVARAAELLGRVDAKLSGVVLNRVPRRQGTEHYGYAYHQNRSSPGTAKLDVDMGPGPEPPGRHSTAEETAAKGGPRP